MSSLPNNIGAKGSFLTDKELCNALNHIFRQGTFDINCVRHSSYQLRLGEKVMVYKRPEVSEEGLKYDEFLPIRWEIDADSRKYIDIWPKRRALLYTKEEFQLAADFVGLVFSRGLLFARGLAPETTYVDPGFQGEFYITVVNINENAVRLYQDMFLARLFTFRLDEPVDEGYVPGKEKGIEQQLCEIPVTKILSYEELNKMKDSELLEKIQKGCSIGDLLNQITINQIKSRSRNRLWLIILSVTFLLTLVWPTVFKLLLKARLPDWFGEQIFVVVVGPSLMLFIGWLVRKIRKKTKQK